MHWTAAMNTAGVYFYFFLAAAVAAFLPFTFFQFVASAVTVHSQNGDKTFSFSSCSAAAVSFY